MAPIGYPAHPAQARRRQEPRFGLPFDARRGLSTGISAADRAYTVRAALEPGVGPDDFAIPGHVLPQAARAGGLAERQGHTEGAVELARRAGLLPAAVMSEVLTRDGQMARGAQLQAFAGHLGLPDRRHRATAFEPLKP